MRSRLVATPLDQKKSDDGQELLLLREKEDDQTDSAEHHREEGGVVHAEVLVARRVRQVLQRCLCDVHDAPLRALLAPQVDDAGGEHDDRHDAEDRVVLQLERAVVDGRQVDGADEVTHVRVSLR